MGQSLPYIGAADLAVSQTCFFYHINSIIIFLCISLQHLMIPAFSIPEGEVRTNNNMCSMKFFVKDFLNKSFSFHRHQISGKGIIDQVIHLSSQQLFSFFFCHQTASLHIKCTYNTDAVVSRIRADLFNQFLMSSVKPVKFSKSYGCSFFLSESINSFYILHNYLNSSGSRNIFTRWNIFLSSIYR